MFKELENVDRVEISHDSFIEVDNGGNSSDFHLELVEVLTPCHAVLNKLPCQLAAYDIVISRKFPRLAFFNKEPFSLRLVSLDFKRQAVLDMLTMANNGLVHDIFNANFPGFYNSNHTADRFSASRISFMHDFPETRGSQL